MINLWITDPFAVI